MKKLLGILLTLCLLTGCGAKPAPSSGGSTQKLPAVSAGDEGTAVTYVVESELVQDNVKNEDGAVLLEYKYDLPRLTAQAADGTALEDTEKAAVFNKAFDQWRTRDSLAELTTAAQEDYALRMEEKQSWTGYSDELTHTVYQTGRLVSVETESYSYTGGAHPNTAYAGWNFDLEQGRFVPVDTLGKDGAAFTKAVAEEIVRQMEGKAAEMDVPIDAMFWSEYTDIVALWTNYAVTFDAQGMCVTFSAYDLASYAAGVQRFRLSYEFLKPYLNDYANLLLGLSA